MNKTFHLSGLIPATYMLMHPNGLLNLEQIPPIVEMLVKQQVVKRGERAGVRFGGCRRYPSCRGVVSIDP